MYAISKILNSIEIFTYACTIAAAFAINLPKARIALGQLSPNHTVAGSLFPENFATSWNLGYNDGANDYQWKLYIRNFHLVLQVNAALALFIFFLRKSTIVVFKCDKIDGRKCHAKIIMQFFSTSFEVSCHQRCIVFSLRLMQCFSRTTVIFFSHGVIGVMFIIVVHGPLAIFPLAFVIAYYVCVITLVRRTPYFVYMIFIWFTTATMHLCAVYYNGYSNVAWLSYLYSDDVNTSALQKLSSLLKQRLAWHVVFGMITLRLISFSYDYWEAVHLPAQACNSASHRHDTACLECALLREKASMDLSRTTGDFEQTNSRQTRTSDDTPFNISASKKSVCAGRTSTLNHFHSSLRCYKFRAQCPHKVEEYRIVSYLAYIFFVPLYFTGPIVSYNAFVSCIRAPSASMPTRRLLLYILIIVFIFLVDYYMLSYYYAITYSQNANLFLKLSVTMRASVTYLALAHLWCKFTVIWRTGTVFAAWCGVDTPEDMPSFFSSISTIQNFWRGWHASFNIWIVRYMYIPLGGRKYKFITIVPIFLYIAIWHDNEMRLIFWAFTMCVAIAIEVLTIQLFKYVTNNVRLEIERQVSGITVLRTPLYSSSKKAADSKRSFFTSPVFFYKAIQQTLNDRAKSLIECIVSHCVLPLSHTMRSFCFNVLCNIAYSAAAIGLIISNVVGFVVQTAQSSNHTISSLQSFDSIVNALSEAGASLTLKIIWIIFCACALSARLRAVHERKKLQLAQSLGLLDTSTIRIEY